MDENFNVDQTVEAAPAPADVVAAVVPAAEPAPVVVPAPVVPATATKIKSDGGSTEYYSLPDNASELNDLIEHKEMGFALGNVFKACYRLGEKEGADIMYDLKKMEFFVTKRLIPYVEKHGRLP